MAKTPRRATKTITPKSQELPPPSTIQIARSLRPRTHSGHKISNSKNVSHKESNSKIFPATNELPRRRRTAQKSPTKSNHITVTQKLPLLNPTRVSLHNSSKIPVQVNPMPFQNGHSEPSLKRKTTGKIGTKSEKPNSPSPPTRKSRTKIPAMANASENKLPIKASSLPLPQKKTVLDNRTCPICHKVCSSPAALCTHIRRHTGEKPFKCPFCPYASIDYNGLSKHTLRHTGEKPYKCQVCSTSFATSGNLQIHLRTHTRDRPYTCPMCAPTKIRSFVTKSHLITHIRSHIQEKPHKCPECQSTFAETTQLKIHLKTRHSTSKPFACNHPGCSFRTNRQHVIQYHVTTHIPLEKRDIRECQICSKKCISLLSLKSHMKVHSQVRQSLKCPNSDCKFVTSRQEYLRRHLETHVKIKGFKCPHHNCHFDSVTKRNLDAHVQRRHSNYDNLPTLKCVEEGCGYQTKKKEDYRRHVANHKIKKAAKLYSCPKCSYETNVEKYLKGHLTRCGLIERTFECPVPNCGYTATTDMYLKRHVRNHGKEKKFKCDQCDYAAKQSGNLKTHILRAHVSAEEKPTYKCEFKECRYTTVCQKSFKTHKVTHCARREKYGCKMCGQSYLIQKSLEVHIRSCHTLEKPFKCDLCGKEFVDRGYLRRHFRAVHKQV